MHSKTTKHKSEQHATYSRRTLLLLVIEVIIVQLGLLHDRYQGHLLDNEEISQEEGSNNSRGDQSTSGTISIRYELRCAARSSCSTWQPQACCTAQGMKARRHYSTSF